VWFLPLGENCFPLLEWICVDRVSSSHGLLGKHYPDSSDDQMVRYSAKMIAFLLHADHEIDKGLLLCTEHIHNRSSSRTTRSTLQLRCA
jgi:hypothetical protein